MALISEEIETGFLKTIPEKPVSEMEDPSIGEIFSAAFAQENTLVSWASKGFSFGESFEPQEDYDAFQDIGGYELFADSFIDSVSPENTAYIKMQLDKEIEDKNTLAAGGASSLFAQVAAGVTDPIYFPLMFTGLGQVKLAGSTVKAFATAAGVGMASEIPAEIAKHATQETRTGMDSVFSIGGATLFSGVIGAGASHLTKTQFKEMGKKMDEVLDDPSPRSVGAAQVSEISDESLTLVGVGKIEKMALSPNIRMATSSSKTTKAIANQMMESSLVIKGAEKGETAIPTGGAVETRIKRWDSGLAQSFEELDGFYKKYREGMGSAKRVVNDYMLMNRQGKLTPKDFRIEIGKAMRRGDAHDIPEVAEAAKAFRRNIFDPLKDAAIESKLLPPDVDVSTARSYLMRVYNTKKMIAKRDEWDQIVFDWFARGRQKNLDEYNVRSGKGEKIPVSLQEQAFVSDAQIREATSSITENILGNSSGRVPYEVKATVRGPLKERVLNIPDSMIEDFLESDIELVAKQYKMTMAPDVELTRAFGNVDMVEDIAAITDDYDELIKKAKNEKQRTDLQLKKERDIGDLTAVRDMLRGNHRVPEDPNSFFIRAGRILRDFNFVRMLGGMTMSAIPDMARPVAVNGLRPMARSLKTLALSPKTFNMSRIEAKRAAVGLDMVLNSRASSLADIADIYARGSAFERGLRSASDAFGKMTLMTQWNAALKQFSGVMAQDRVLADVVKWSTGTAKKSVIKRLAAGGIDEPMAKRIADQFKKFGDTGDLNLSNGHLWDDTEALDTFRSTILKEVDRTILTPGVGEKPLWTTGETGKLIFQFKTFAATAHHKVLIADLQYRDAAALNGFLMSVGLGTVTYGLKQYVADRPIETEPEKLIIESLDRSGAFGYFWDVNNTIEKMTRGEIGVNKLAGAAPMSRYASRNAVGALLGPSFGTAQDVVSVTGALSQGEFSVAEIHKVRKLLAGQNLFYMRRLLNELEDKVAD